MTRPTHMIIAVFVLLAGVLLFLTPIKRFLFGERAMTSSVLVSGNIEAHQSVLSFTDVQSAISWLPFDEGKFVQAGTVLARVDDRLYQQQLQIDRAAVAVAQKQIAVNQSNFVAARNTVTSDRLDLANKNRNFVRDRAQSSISAISRQSFDLTSTVAAQAAAILARDEALMRGAQQNVALARANLKSNEAKLELDQITLSYTVLKAPFSGVLAVREAELGELAGPGVAIFTLDDLDHVWLRAYINERNLGQIRLGEPVTVSTDTYPGHHYQGRIGFIASEAEFTPKTVETHAERVTLVYRLRIDIDNPTHELLPGMPAQAMMTLLSAGK